MCQTHGSTLSTVHGIGYHNQKNSHQTHHLFGKWLVSLLKKNFNFNSSFIFPHSIPYKHDTYKKNWMCRVGRPIGEDLGNSPGWWATTVATCCPSRMVEHPKSKSTKPCARPLGSHCTCFLLEPMRYKGVVKWSVVTFYCLVHVEVLERVTPTKRSPLYLEQSNDVDEEENTSQARPH